MTNQQFVREHVSTLLLTCFPNLTKSQISTFVLSLFDRNLDLAAFKSLLRDFLVHLKEFQSDADNQELFSEENQAAAQQQQAAELAARMAVPGIVPQSHMPLDSDEGDL